MTALVSDRFWYLTYFVPLYGAYALWGYAAPYVRNFRNASSNEPEERESKHEKRMRERRERRQQKSGGNRR